MDGITYALGQYLTVFVDELEVQYAAASVVHSLLPAVTLSCGVVKFIMFYRFIKLSNALIIFFFKDQ